MCDVNGSAVEALLETSVIETGEPSNSFSAEFIVIGGGGSYPHSNTVVSDGKNNITYAGGGAGGYISSVVGESSGGGTAAVAPINVKGSLNITVGDVDNNSVIDNRQGTVITAFAGNTGSGGGGDVGEQFSLPGGGPGGGGTSGQGYRGSAGYTFNSACFGDACFGSCDNNNYCGAGGGAGGTGTGQNGGIGVQSSITGTPTYYAGGGASNNTCPSGSVGTPGLGYDSYGGGANTGSNAYPGVVFLKLPVGTSLSQEFGGTLIYTTQTINDYVLVTCTSGSGTLSFQGGGTTLTFTDDTNLKYFKAGDLLVDGPPTWHQHSDLHWRWICLSISYDWI